MSRLHVATLILGANLLVGTPGAAFGAQDTLPSVARFAVDIALVPSQPDNVEDDVQVRLDPFRRANYTILLSRDRASAALLVKAIFVLLVAEEARSGTTRQVAAIRVPPMVNIPAAWRGSELRRSEAVVQQLLDGGGSSRPIRGLGSVLAKRVWLPRARFAGRLRAAP